MTCLAYRHNAVTDSQFVSTVEENPEVFKDLRKLFDHLQDRESMSPTRKNLLGDFLPGVENTLLVESKAPKCRLQPLNFVCIPEYEEKLHLDSIIAAHGDWRAPRVLGSATAEDRAELFRKIFGCDALTFFEKHVSTGSTNDEHHNDPILKLDVYLVAFVGIFSELRHVLSIPVWIAAGGLQPDVDHTFTEGIAREGWSHVVGIDSGSIDLAVPKLEFEHHVPPSKLPSETVGQEWYQSPIHMLYWLRRGLLALDSRGIAVDHGLGRRQKESGRWR